MAQPNNNYSISLKKIKYRGPNDSVEGIQLTKGNEYDVFVTRNYDRDLFPCIDVIVLDHGRCGTISYSEPKYAKEHWGKDVCEANDAILDLE